MNDEFVVDSSVTLTWFFKDQASPGGPIIFLKSLEPVLVAR